jgi:hypothetical protein
MKGKCYEQVIALYDCAGRDGRRWYFGTVGWRRSGWGCSYDVLLQAVPTDTSLWFGPDELIIGHATGPR